MKARKKILVAPLDWGLGHATRCIPIIRHILSSGHEVLIAADGRALDLLKAEFPQVQALRLKGYHPVYPARSMMVYKMALQTPRFLKVIFDEHRQLQHLIDREKIDGVISDNRYGLWTDKVPCILLTHQVFIKMPDWAAFMQASVNRLNHFFISKYTQCWVPDTEDEEGLSGELSHGNELPRNVKFIGILTRFERDVPGLEKTEAANEVLVILSGPEPQRSIFEETVVREIQKTSLNTLVVRGITENTDDRTIGNIRLVSNFNAVALNRAILNSRVIIARSGYSNMMDLVYLNKPAILVPTPGQTEQEYLAKTLAAKKYCCTQMQEQFNLQAALKDWETCRIPEHLFASKEQFSQTVDGLLGMV